MLYGETGRFPLKIIIKSRMISYWNRLIHSKGIKISFLMYQCLMNSENLSSKWASSIKNIFTEIGRPDIWLFQQNVQSKSLSSLTKRILVEQFKQEWRSNCTKSVKAFTYFCYKHNFEMEKYYFTVPRKVYLPLFKLRTSNHKLPVETGRWTRPKTARHQRICPLCISRDIGDEYHYICKCPYFAAERATYVKPYYIKRPSMYEYHYICKCPYFAAERATYVKPYYIKRPSMYKFCNLLGSTNENQMRKLSQFAQIIFRKFV